MKDLLTTFLSAGAIQFINIATGILAARLLLPEGRGELAILLLWPVLIADLGSFSLSTSVSYHTARKEHTIREIGAGALLIITALFPILIAIFLALAPTIYAGHRPEVMRLAVICAILIPTYMYALSLMSLFQGSQKFGSYKLLRSLVHFGYIGFAIILLLFPGSNLEAFVYAYVGAHVLVLGSSIWLSRKNSWISLKPVIAVVRSLAFYGMRAHVGVVLAVANRRLDQMILSIALAATDLGLYVVAMTVEGPLFLAAVTMEMLLFPKLASQSDESARQKTLGRYFRASLILVVPATILFLVLAPWLIGIVFGQAYLPAVDAARILALSGIGYTLKVMLTTHMRASNRMRIVTQSEGIGILATVVALLVLLPPFGLIGAAIAQVLAITVPALFMAFKINRDTGLSIVALFQFEKRDWRVFDEVFARFNRAGPK
jgi:O-antigen/teichoic acid export membrane protein